jgi:hypothetical protein
MSWQTIGVQVLSFVERQEMLGPRQVGRPVTSTDADWSVITER